MVDIMSICNREFTYGVLVGPIDVGQVDLSGLRKVVIVEGRGVGQCQRCVSLRITCFA